MLDDKVARVRELIAKRDEIDVELAQLLGVEEKKKTRGRPRKQQESGDAGPGLPLE